MPLEIARAGARESQRPSGGSLFSCLAYGRYWKKT